MFWVIFILSISSSAFISYGLSAFFDCPFTHSGILITWLTLFCYGFHEIAKEFYGPNGSIIAIMKEFEKCLNL